MSDTECLTREHTTARPWARGCVFSKYIFSLAPQQSKQNYYFDDVYLQYS